MLYTMTDDEQRLSRQIAWSDGWSLILIIETRSGNAEPMISDAISQFASKGTPAVDARASDADTFSRNFHSFAVGDLTDGPTILGVTPECSTIPGDAWQEAFGFLNSSRDSMRRRDIPLLLVIPAEHHDRLIRSAADLWSIRDLTITI